MSILTEIFASQMVLTHMDIKGTFKLDMERLGIVPKKTSKKVIDFKAYVHRK